MIHTVKDLISAWGGHEELARWADVGPTAVSNWKTWNEIPGGYHLPLYLEAKARGLRLAPQLFGYERWPGSK